MKYAIRSAKYFLVLCVLCAALMVLNRALGWATLTPGETFYVMFHTPRGVLLPAMIVLLAAFYPRFGFVVRKVEGDVVRNREQIVNAFLSAGFSLHDEHEDEMTFRAKGFVHRLMLLWEDEIRVTQQDDRIVLDGIRRGVARVQYRLESYIQMTGND